MSAAAGERARFAARSLRELPALTRFVLAQCRRLGGDSEAGQALRLALEEAFTNIYRHGYRDAEGPVEVAAEPWPDGIRFIVRDRAPAFDPTTRTTPTPLADWHERAPGGLGLPLLRASVDELAWRRSADDENVLTLSKRFRPSTAGHSPGGTHADPH